MLNGEATWNVTHTASSGQGVQEAVAWPRRRGMIIPVRLFLLENHASTTPSANFKFDAPLRECMQKCYEAEIAAAAGLRAVIKGASCKFGGTATGWWNLLPVHSGSQRCGLRKSVLARISFWDPPATHPLLLVLSGLEGSENWSCSCSCSCLLPSWLGLLRDWLFEPQALVQVLFAVPLSAVVPAHAVALCRSWLFRP